MMYKAKVAVCSEIRTKDIYAMYSVHIIFFMLTLWRRNYRIFLWITRMTLTSGRVRKYRPLLTEDTGVIPKNVPD